VPYFKEPISRWLDRAGVPRPSELEKFNKRKKSKHEGCEIKIRRLNELIFVVIYEMTSEDTARVKTFIRWKRRGKRIICFKD